jgi:hypothetical protein
MRCLPHTICINGKCVPFPQPNPCATMLCAPNTRCEVTQIYCIRAPCPPPQGRCVPINNTETENPCNLVDCMPNTRCQLKKVQCVRAPCPPIPECVPINKTGPIIVDKCANIFCTADSTCIDGKCVPIDGPRPTVNPCAAMLCPTDAPCKVIQVECKKAPCPPPQGQCVPINNTHNEDPCATIKCSAGTECVVAMPGCIKGATDCGPKAVCVPTDIEVASMPPAIDEPTPPIELTIPNNFCMRARCAFGCLTTGIKCNEDGTECEYLGQCGPEDKNVSSIHVCENSTCPKGKICEEEIVQCFAPPCLPIPKCVDKKQQ